MVYSISAVETPMRLYTRMPAPTYQFNKPFSVPSMEDSTMLVSFSRMNMNVPNAKEYKEKLIIFS